MDKKDNTKKRRFRNDFIMILCILTVALGGIIYLNFFRSHGNTVSVTVDGEIYGVYPLSEDIAEDIYTGEDLCNHNRLVISDGKAYVAEATCPDGICAAHKPIFREGESIICLPNRVVITVSAENYSDSPDIVV